MPDLDPTSPPGPADRHTGTYYLRPYAEAARQHGPGFRATLWQNEQKQAERFAVIAGMIDLTGRRVLDAGAGLGDLARWLDAHHVAYRAYLGLEGVPALVETALAAPPPRAGFVLADFATDADAFSAHRWPDSHADEHAAPHRPDVIVFSGSLNTFKLDDALPVLQRAWESTTVGIAFNFLNARHRPGVNDPGSGQPAWRFDPFVLLDWAMEQTSKVRYRQDYFDGHDATITMERW
jgi:hypothetical protein